MIDKAICSGKSAWYGVTEPVKLRVGRMLWSDGPLISVYIPTHNRADLLVERALRSVFEQTYPNIEAIVIAHGCTDDTIARVRRFCPLSRNAWRSVRAVPIERTAAYPETVENHWFAGRVQPSNVGLSECRGQWIATIDDDDMWRPDHLESVLGFARRGNYEFVSAAGVNQKGGIEPYELDGVKVGPIQTWLYRSYLGWFRFNPDCWRKSWNRVCDTDLQDRFRKAGVRMGYLDKVTVDILPRPGETETGLKAHRRDPEKTLKVYAFR